MQAADQFRRTPLYIAARLGKEKETDTLISMGVDINMQGPNGNTALHAAACAGRRHIVQKLLSHGASPTILNGDGHLPVQMTDLERIHDLFFSTLLLIVSSSSNSLQRASRSKFSMRLGRLSRQQL
jgi:ankyrin repeat protein